MRLLLCKNHIPSSGNVETKDSACAISFVFMPAQYFKKCGRIATYCIRGIIIREGEGDKEN